MSHQCNPVALASAPGKQSSLNTIPADYFYTVAYESQHEILEKQFEVLLENKMKQRESCQT
jgi:hypothetical protein